MYAIINIQKGVNQHSLHNQYNGWLTFYLTKNSRKPWSEGGYFFVLIICTTKTAKAIIKVKTSKVDIQPHPLSYEGKANRPTDCVALL